MKFLSVVWLVLFASLVAGYSTERPVLAGFTKQVDVFGIHIYASANTPDDKVLHAARVLAQYLDNNQDGKPDNQRVVDAMVKRQVTLVMARDEEELRSFNNNLYTAGPSPYQDLYPGETHPNGTAPGVFDATLEEILHPITDVGYSDAYPDVFGVTPGTEVAKAMDIARGGHFEKIPGVYPENAWYTYYDKTCGYGCQIAEYVYWALTSMLGAQDFPGRLEQIKNEWKLNTREKIKTGDPGIYKLLSDPRYKFPTVLPDGNYQAKTFKIRKYPD
jgi:hypothetical protein